MGGALFVYLRMIRSLIHAYAGLASLLVVIGFFWVGLTPFDPRPDNGVEWLEGGSGLRFRRGSVLGIASPTPDPSAACSVEIWARPASNQGSSVLVAFFDPRGESRFVIEQNDRRALWVRKWTGRRIDDLWVRRRFAPGGPLLITVASNGEETSVYFDDVLAETSARVGATQADCGDSFVLGTGPTSDAVWNGDLLGLAIYDRVLPAEEVAGNYRAWASQDTEDIARGGATAFYLFDEGSGETVRDGTGAGRDLRIPLSFVVPSRTFLESPGWATIRMNDLDWPDIVMNVLGFSPFGFFFGAFLVSRRHSLGAATALVLSTGFLISLTIESLQSFLPTRTSSMTDLATNVLGAGLGAWLCWRLLPRPDDTAQP